ncbi:MAG: glycosyltransferase family 2 protein [Clostridium sp.]|nr:glycosyltransferase family 2 protein [Clostridium sp.]
MKLTVIVPCYNESKNINVFYDRINCILNEIGIENEMLFVDDGSSDDTVKRLIELNEKYNNVSYITLTRNFGKEAAMLAGMRNVSEDSDYVAIMDADLQDPPELIKDMLDGFDDDTVDCIAARRVNRKGEPFLRSWFSKLFYKIVNKVTEIHIPDGARDFRIMKKSMNDSIAQLPETSRFSKGLFAWVGYNTKWISYENVARENGKTKWSFFKLFSYAIDGILSFSTFPLVISSLAGIVTCMISLIVILYMIIQKLFVGIDVEGYAFMVCVILFLGGVQLSCIGIVGAYLSKIFKETKARPVYLVKEHVSSKNNGGDTKNA